MHENDKTGLDYLLPYRVYGVLKWLALIALPAVAVFVQVVGPSWGLPHVDHIVTTIDAIGVLIGTRIGVSEINAKLTLAA